MIFVICYDCSYFASFVWNLCFLFFLFNREIIVFDFSLFPDVLFETIFTHWPIIYRVTT